MEEMTLIVCCSHLYVPTMLSLLENNGNCCIYTDKIDIKEMISFLKIKSDVFFDKDAMTAFHRLGLIKQRKKLMKVWVSHKNITQIYFFHEGYCEAANWLMLQLAKSSDIKFHYVPIARSYFLDKINKAKGLSSKLKSLYCCVVWGYMPIFPQEDKNCSVMQQSFYNKLHIKKEETIEIDSSVGESILPEEFDKNGIVLLENPNLSDLQSEKNYSFFLAKALGPVASDYPVYFKNHPGKTKKVGLENDIAEIPSFISGNMLTRRFRAFVGVNSALLCEAANDGTLSICLAYLVDMDESVRKEIVRYHRLLSDKVIFPQSIEELINILRVFKS